MPDMVNRHNASIIYRTASLSFANVKREECIKRPFAAPSAVCVNRAHPELANQMRRDLFTNKNELKLEIELNV